MKVSVLNQCLNGFEGTPGNTFLAGGPDRIGTGVGGCIKPGAHSDSDYSVSSIAVTSVRPESWVDLANGVVRCRCCVTVVDVAVSSSFYSSRPNSDVQDGRI